MRYLLIILLFISTLSFGQREGCMSGNSTFADGYGQQAVAYFMLNGADSTNGYTINSIAQGSRTIVEQMNTYLAQANKKTFSWMIIEIGLNDMNPATTTITQDIAALQAYVDTVRYWNPTCFILLATMTPCRQRLEYLWGADGYKKWRQYNDAIMNRADTTNNITGVDYRIESHTIALSDGNGNLAAIYDTGDHIHQNDAARLIMANYFRAVLIHFKKLYYVRNNNVAYSFNGKLLVK